MKCIISLTERLMKKSWLKVRPRIEREGASF